MEGWKDARSGLGRETGSPECGSCSGPAGSNFRSMCELTPISHSPRNHEQNLFLRRIFSLCRHPVSQHLIHSPPSRPLRPTQLIPLTHVLLLCLCTHSLIIAKGDKRQSRHTSCTSLKGSYRSITRLANIAAHAAVRGEWSCYRPRISCM